MAIVATRLTPHFAAQIDGADITRLLDDATWAEIRAAFEEHSILVFRGRTLDDETLTEVRACRSWSPVGFTVDGFDGPRLRRYIRSSVHSHRFFP